MRLFRELKFNSVRVLELGPRLNEVHPDLLELLLIPVVDPLDVVLYVLPKDLPVVL